MSDLASKEWEKHEDGLKLASKLLKLKEELKYKINERDEMLELMKNLSDDDKVKEYINLEKTDKIKNYIDLERESSHLYRWIEVANKSISEIEQQICKHPVLFYISDVSYNYVNSYSDNSPYAYYICLDCLKRFQTVIDKELRKKMVGITDKFNTEESIEYYYQKYQELRKKRNLTFNDITYELKNEYELNNKQKVK